MERGGRPEHAARVGADLAARRRQGRDAASELAGPAHGRAARRVGEFGSHGAQRSGLPLDPMFSALKLCWLLDEIDPDRSRASSGDWCMGTIDATSSARLGGEQVVEAGNASRTA